MKRSIVLNAPQTEFLEQEADQFGITVSELIRRILDQYMVLQALYGARWVAEAVEKNVYELLKNGPPQSLRNVEE
jgi:hypothetical protein